jgi:hypothetical protein
VAAVRFWFFWLSCPGLSVLHENARSIIEAQVRILTVPQLSRRLVQALGLALGCRLAALQHHVFSPAAAAPMANSYI